jgi:alpha-galactosidase
MAEKLVILGVGSTYFTRSLLESLIRVGGEWHVGMVDIEPKPLGVAMRLGKRMADLYEAPISITGSTDRTEVLEGASSVVSVIGVGGRRGWMEDLLLGRRHGKYQTTADTAGIGGLSRALRTVPALLEIAADIEAICPDALLVNFSNPMTVNCRALTQNTSIRTIGLCTGVRHFQQKLASIVNVPPEETWCEAVGVNHFTWITQLRHGTRDILVELLARADRGEILPGGRFTTELFRSYRLFPVVGDHHISEFYPNVLGEGEFYGETLGFDGEKDTAAEYFRHFDDMEADLAAQADGAKPIEKADLHDPERQYTDEDFYADLLLALRGQKELCCTVNLPNTGQSASLPESAIVESNALINASGIHPFCTNPLPPGVVAVLMRIIGAQELAAEAAVRGSRRLAAQTLLTDLTARNLGEAEAMVEDILKTHRDQLPQFFS